MAFLETIQNYAVTEMINKSHDQIKMGEKQKMDACNYLTSTTKSS